MSLAQTFATPAQTEASILDFKEAQQKDGRTNDTIRTRIQQLRQVSQICDLNDPDIIKTWLSDTKNEHGFTKPCKWNNRTKNRFIDTYAAYLRHRKIMWEKPHYAIAERLPFIPTEQEIDQLIASCGKRTATLLQLLKETGMRIGELTQLKETDIDYVRKTVNITPEKNSKPRILPLTDKLLDMLRNLPRDPRAKYSTVFQHDKDILRSYFCTHRKELAQKLNNPRLLKIGFHTFRHWKGTMEYHKLRDLRAVQKILGHKSIVCTQIYENTEQALFTEQTDEFIVKAAKTADEVTKLLEAGFTKADEIDGYHLYRKRK